MKEFLQGSLTLPAEGDRHNFRNTLSLLIDWHRVITMIGKELTLLACRVRQIGFFWCHSFSWVASYYSFEIKCSFLEPRLCLPWPAVTLLVVQLMLCCMDSSLLRKGCAHPRIDSHSVGTLGRTSSSMKSIWYQTSITLKPRSWHLSTGTVDFKPQHQHQAYN